MELNPTLSLSKSPQLRADVSHSPALPSPSLETALNRWASQQVQESAQVPPTSCLLLYSKIHASFLCPWVVRVVLCWIRRQSLRLHPAPLCFTELPTCLAERSGGLTERLSEQITNTNAWDLSIIAGGKQVVALCCEQEQALLQLPGQKQGCFFCVLCVTCFKPHSDRASFTWRRGVI